MRNPFSRFTHQGAPITPTDAQMRLEEVGELIEALDAVSRDELPNGATRLALTRAIVAGEIDALYRPLGASAHNVCIAGMPPDVDPRITVAQWVMCWRASVRPVDILLRARRAHLSITDVLAVTPATLADATPNAEGTY